LRRRVLAACKNAPGRDECAGLAHEGNSLGAEYAGLVREANPLAGGQTGLAREQIWLADGPAWLVHEAKSLDHECAGVTCQ